MMALTKDVVNFRGNYFKFFNVPIEMRPYQLPHPPVWYATGSPESTAWAATQNMNICFLSPTERARVLVDAYKSSWDKTYGGSGKKMPKIGLTRHIFVADDDKTAVERGMFGYKGWFDKYAYLWAKHDPRPPAPFDPAVHRSGGRIIMGSPATVRAELEREIEATGINYFVARFAYGDLTHEESARSLELFASEVMPHFQSKTAAASALIN
jgi:alkanesulfonate monooxygenase SsuD/methylene tetrahydromethanopterin reductase-like flavin-dependent oxidoreductase (luciferase family)